MAMFCFRRYSHSQKKKRNSQKKNKSPVEMLFNSFVASGDFFLFFMFEKNAMVFFVGRKLGRRFKQKQFWHIFFGFYVGLSLSPLKICTKTTFGSPFLYSPISLSLIGTIFKLQITLPNFSVAFFHAFLFNFSFTFNKTYFD